MNNALRASEHLMAERLGVLRVGHLGVGAAGGELAGDVGGGEGVVRAGGSGEEVLDQVDGGLALFLGEVGIVAWGEGIELVRGR